MFDSARGRMALGLVAGVAALASSLVLAAGAAAVGEPDLSSRLPERTPAYVQTLGGKLVYRFDAVIWNAISAGAFELMGSGCTFNECTTVVQRIWADGTPGGDSQDVVIPSGRLIRELGDGHGHYHYENAADYRLLVPEGPDRISAKVGFCMFDTFADNSPISYYSPVTSCNWSAGTVRMGISPGWGDIYPASIAFQWIDITDLPAGDYQLQATADPGNTIQETDETNNALIETRTIPGATAESLAQTLAPGTSTTVALVGTLVGPGVKFDGKTAIADGSLTFAITTEPQHGSRSAINVIDAATATVDYASTPGYEGPDSFAYTTTDSRGLTSQPATVSLVVGNAPANIAAPTVEGPAEAGQILSATPGTWAGTAPFSFGYAWQRCDVFGLACAAIAGAVGQTYAVTEADVDQTIRVVVTAAGIAGSAAAASATTAVVQAVAALEPGTRVLAILGTRRADRLRGTKASEFIRGRRGADRISARGGDDVVLGERGRDRIYAGGGNDLVVAGKGNDWIRVRDGQPDTVRCGKGRDTVIADALDEIHTSCERVFLPA